MIPVQITKENSAYLADALLLDTSKEAQDAVENHSMMLSAKELFPVLETMKQIRQYGTVQTKIMDTGTKEVCSTVEIQPCISMECGQVS